MRILGTEIVRAFPDRIVNTHPSLLPAFPGAHAVRETLAYGVRVSGCTVHLVDEEVDHGPVLLQVAVPIEDGDDERRLHERIKVQERRLLPAAVRLVAFDRVHLDGRRARLDPDPARPLPAEAARSSEDDDVPDRQPVRRALVSVFDKQGLDRLAAALGGAGVEVVSTGSTALALEGHRLTVTRVEELTGAPEMLGGRVKTLHPFEQAVADPEAGDDLAIERIDIGGPSMLRAAAKNHTRVAVVCDPADYGLVGDALAAGGTTLEQRRVLAAHAFARSAAYDAVIAAWFAGRAGAPEGEEELPAILPLGARRKLALRYGENPHQAAALYTATQPGAPRPWGLAAATQLAGKELSYNNLLDADAALDMAAEYADRPFAV